MYQDEEQDQPQQGMMHRMGQAAASVGRGIQRYRQGQQQGWRGDGGQVPGNQPGGANGAFGRYGQMPNTQPPQAQPGGGPMPQPNTPPQAAGWQQRMASYAPGLAQGMHNMQAAGQVIGHAMGYRRPQPPGQMQSSVGGPPPPMNSGPQEMHSSVGGPPPPMPGGYGSSSEAAGSGGGSSPAYGEQMQSDMGAPPSQNVQTANTAEMPQMAHGGMVTRPTVALLGEHGPEAVVPMHNQGAKLTPGMFEPSRRYRPTGPTSLHNPLHSLDDLNRR